MSLRRLAPPDIQPASFAFNAENAEWAKAHHRQISARPGRQSAVISLLWRGQEQEGWVTHPMIEVVAKMLGMPFIRVLEVATFYTCSIWNRSAPGWCRSAPPRPAGCAAPMPWWKLSKTHIAPHQHTVSKDGKFSWMEVECLGACVNAPMLQIGSDFYEDLDGPVTEKLIAGLRAGNLVKPGPQNSRHMSEPEGGCSDPDRSGAV